METKSIMEQLFFTTVRMEILKISGNTISATSFFFNYTKENKTIPFLVTNYHVLKDSKSIKITFHKSVSIDKSTTYSKDEKIPIQFDLTEKTWFNHPNDEIDIAILPIAPIINQIHSKSKENVFYKAISPEVIPSTHQRESLDAIEDILFIGYPESLYDKANYFPIARKGITATPISADYEKKKAFLLDGSIFPGSSGSPVFLINIGSYSPKSGGLVVGNRVFFLGVISSVIAKVKGKTINYLDLGIVFRSETVLETIDSFISSKNINI